MIRSEVSAEGFRFRRDGRGVGRGRGDWDKGGLGVGEGRFFVWLMGLECG